MSIFNFITQKPKLSLIAIALLLITALMGSSNFKLDASDWDLCPIHKDTSRQFECTKKILPETVIEGITRSLV